MASTYMHLRLRLELVATVIWYGFLVGLMLYAAFSVGPPMGFAMIGMMILLGIRRRFD